MKEFKFTLQDIDKLFADFSRDQIIVSPDRRYALYRMERDDAFEVRLLDENNDVIGQQFYDKGDIKKMKNEVINYLLSINLI